MHKPQTSTRSCFLSWDSCAYPASITQARRESGSWATPSSSPMAGERQLRAVLVCCQDCVLPVEAILGEAAGDVLVIRCC